MRSPLKIESNTCGRYLSGQSHKRLWQHPFSRQDRLHSSRGTREDSGGGEDGSQADPSREQGAMSRLLKEITEQALQDRRSLRKAVSDGGFSEELKKKLEERIAQDISGKLESKASATLSMPASAGRGTRDIAEAKPWSGNETVEEQSLRMLTDAHRPLRTGRRERLSIPRKPSRSVDTRIKGATKATSGTRLANARDRTSIYAISKDPNLSEKEKEEMRKVLKERFQPGARPMPNSIQGLSSLANERIEDAIARGQFKNIARGRGVNTNVDYNANSPFLNTTEYFMNKMIQRQDIVPPWIEKQQEVIKTAQSFRSRLRNDWKRHAARMIASKGGTLQEQICRAEAYAAAETKLNPKPQKIGAIASIDITGKLTQPDTVDMLVPISEIDIDSKGNMGGQDAVQAERVIDNEQDLSDALRAINSSSNDSAAFSTERDDITSAVREQDHLMSTSAPAEPLVEIPQSISEVRTFRDPAWESVEIAYHRAALRELNSLTRSYNLMAPELAKRPYYSLERELASCFADVAPQLANEIKERAHRPAKTVVNITGHKSGGVLERFGGESTKVYDSRKPHYGFKQFWQDFWSSRDEGKT